MVRHTDLLSERRMLKHRMVFGYYPEVVTHPGEEKAILKELADSYLYKDILFLEQVRKPDKLVRLVQALALQVGSQVSYNELGQLVGLDAKPWRNILMYWKRVSSCSGFPPFPEIIGMN